MTAPAGPLAPARVRLGPSEDAAAAEPERASHGAGYRWAALVVAVGLVAFVLRLQMEVRGGGLLSIGAYDDGVHLAAAASMLHGRVPYRDFLFLQAPGMLLAASPFAAVARVLGDPTALRMFRVAFEVVGALNAVVVTMVLRRFGWAAAVSGAVLYAVFAPAVYDERTALLEPVGTLGVLTALLLLPRATAGRRSDFVAAGAALGIACDFKIWYVVAAIVVVAFARGGRLRVVLGIAIAGGAAYLPFFLAAPRQMFQQVVLDQLGRPRAIGGTLGVRLRSLLGVSGTHGRSPFPGVAPNLVLAALLVVLAAAVVVAVLERRAWLFVALAAADSVVVLVSPSFFPHYASLLAPPLTLIVGVAVGRMLAPVRRRAVRAVAVGAVVVAVVLLNVQHDREPVGVPSPVAALQAAAARVPGCVVSDDPTVLAVMNVLTRNLDHGCPLRPDVSGYSYGPDAVKVHGEPLSRARNARYQRNVVAYLRSGSALLLVRHDTGLNRTSMARLDSYPVLFRAGGYVIRATGR